MNFYYTIIIIYLRDEIIPETTKVVFSIFGAIIISKAQVVRNNNSKFIIIYSITQFSPLWSFRIERPSILFIFSSRRSCILLQNDVNSISACSKGILEIWAALLAYSSCNEKYFKGSSEASLNSIARSFFVWHTTRVLPQLKTT